MEITKRLFLNKTPKNVLSGALTCAKNIMIDDTGSFITNEWGLSVAFECPNDNEFIVGCITCTNEIVVFTYQVDTSKSRIYRLKDDGTLTECSTSWIYNGGTLVGSYTYNYKGELIIAISEYGAVDTNNNTIYVPLKSWNLDTQNDTGQTYNIEEKIPKFKTNYTIDTNGSLVCGVYTFFIRFLIDDANYTKWFQISDDIVIIETITKSIPVHHFLPKEEGSTGNKEPNSVTVVGYNEGRDNDYTYFNYNENEISNKSITITLEHNDKQLNFTKYQIGYIIKRGSETLGRIKNTYDIANTIINITDNVYREEETIDNFLINPTQYYNVKNLITYNNRLYISNYSEYPNENLQSYADKIRISEITHDVVNPNVNYEFSKENYGVSGYFLDPANIIRLSTISTYEEDGNIYINNPYNFILNYIAKYIYTDNQENSSTNIVSDSIIYPNDGIVTSIRQSFYLSVYKEGEENKAIGIWNSNTKSSNNIRLRLQKNSNNDDGTIVIVGTDGYEVVLNGIDSKCRVLCKVEITPAKVGEPKQIGYFYFGSNQVTPEIPTSFPYFQCQLLYTHLNYHININDNYVYNNLRSLIPGQIYNFFVHFIREDFSATNGFKITNIANNSNKYTNDNGDVFFMAQAPSSIYNIQNETKSLRWIKFDSITIPKGYIGVFFTYEEIEETSCPVTALAFNGEKGWVSMYNDDDRANITEVNITNSEYLYNIAGITGIKLEPIMCKELTTDVEANIVTKEFHKTSSRENYVTLTINAGTDLATNQTNGHTRKYTLRSKIDTIYNKEFKTLYRLSPNIYDGESYDEDTAYMFLPGFYNHEQIISFNIGANDSITPDGIILSATSSNVMSVDTTSNADNGTIINNYTVRIFTNYNWCKYPLDAMSIKQDYEEGAVSLVNKDGDGIGVYYNKVIAPAKLHDLFEFQACYTSVPSKTYTNYSENNIDTFDKTIRRSDVISDESLFNGFRWFQVDNYKIIQENKGDIINLVGIGLYLIVHTRYSLFVFDRSNRLNAKAQLEIPDTFDVDYQEVLPSNEGFGGLVDKEESIVSKNGYIWYDRDNKVIFNFVNGKITTLSTDINNLIKHLDIAYVRFAEDIDNNRLLICFYINDTYYVDNNNVEYDTIDEDFQLIVTSDNNIIYQTISGKVYYLRYKCITLSYNFYTNTFISLHDYKFTNNWRTYKKSYLFDKNADRKRLYTFDINSHSYHNLTITHPIIYKQYV